MAFPPASSVLLDDTSPGIAPLPLEMVCSCLLLLLTKAHLLRPQVIYTREERFPLMQETISLLRSISGSGRSSIAPPHPSLLVAAGGPREHPEWVGRGCTSVPLGPHEWELTMEGRRQERILVEQSAAPGYGNPAATACLFPSGEPPA